jgi:uncharacterized protein YcgI (DUF1989 family)
MRRSRERFPVGVVVWIDSESERNCTPRAARPFRSSIKWPSAPGPPVALTTWTPLCFDAGDRSDRYSATNTIKVHGNIYIGVDTVLYSDRGTALFTIITDTCGRHDTIYGCCSEANNFLRYGVRGTPSCYANFREILAGFGLDERAIVGNVNFFMSVPVLPDGSAGITNGISQPGGCVELRAERDVLSVLSIPRCSSS